MRPDNIEDIYPLSPVQQGILFHTLYAPEAGDYFRQLVFAIQGELDIAAFARTWQEVVDRNPILRTAFVWEADESMQVVCRKVEVPLEQQDWRGMETARRETALADHLLQDRRRGFELSEAPVIRLALFRLGDKSYRFVWSYHHLLLDGWSVALLLRRIFATYRALTRGERLPFERVRPYRDYIAWLKAQDGARSEAFWRQTLAGFSGSTPLPLEPAEPKTEHRTGSLSISLPEGLTTSLQSLSRANRLTLNSLLQGAWALLLSRYSGEPDIVFGATSSGRPTDLPGFETMIGLFINTLPVRARVPADVDLVAWLRRLQAVQADSRQFEYAPLVDIQGWSEVPRGQPLFESILVFENYRIDEAIPERDAGLEVRRLDLVDGTSYPLSLIIRPESRLVLRLLFDASRLDIPAAQRLLGHLGELLRSFAAAPKSPLASFSLLTEAERQQTVVEWNATGTAYREQHCLHELFSLQARRTGEDVALVFAGETLTYRELDLRSNQLAHHLRSLGVVPETRVGLCLERSLEMVVALLGVLKAGGAYVPIDPSYPMQRQAWMLEDSAASVVLTQRRLAAGIPATGTRVLALDEAWGEIVARPEHDPGVPLPDGSLAYVIFTSGSTGRPKGAMNTHRAVRNRILWMQEAYGLDSSDSVLQKTPFSFDVSVWEFFWPLLTGARLVIARPEGHRDPAYLAALIREQGITTLHFVPPMLQVFLEEPTVPSCRTLRRVICSGEALPAELERRFFSRLDAGLHNLYGPTEAAVDATFWPCERDAAYRSVPIGRPIANLRIHLLDLHLQPVPAGIPGELHIGGAGVARGYVGKPGLTADRFVPDPLAESPGERLYRTGDLARFLSGGAIEFLGRLDHQVKVRGFRIELGEIEAALTSVPEIREAIVLARDDHGKGKLLVAYLVGDGELVAGDLRGTLQASLPDYMIPALFVQLATLPLSPNGKVDRAALPAPEGARLCAGRPFTAPRNDVERDLAEIWMEVLRAGRVGIDDNFFELGGDSIRSIQVLARARARGLSFALPQIFRYPTVRELAAQVGQMAGEKLPASQPFSLTGEEDRARIPAGIVDAYPLAFLQAGMLFHSELRSESSVYHDIFSYHFDADLDLPALRLALERLLARHPVLRTSFHLTGFSEPLQLVHAAVEAPLAVEDLRHLSEAEQERAVAAWIENEKRNPLPWTRAPLLRIQVHLRAAGTFQLSLSFHHAILDGWSVAAMLTELFLLYQAEGEGREGALQPPPGVEFRQFVALERAALESRKSRGFWLEELAGSSFLALPRQPGLSASGLRVRRVPIPPGVSEGLWRLANSVSAPLKSVLLAAHLRVLALVGSQVGPWDLVTGLVSNGRPETADGDRVLGLFLNTLPLRLRTDGGTWLDLVRAVFEAERLILPHRRFPLSELQRLRGGQPLFETAFNYVHFHVREALGRTAGLQAIGGVSYEETNFPLYVNFRLRPGSTLVELDLRLTELGGPQAEAFAGYFARVLATMAAAPLGQFEAAPLLDEAERHQILVEWNDTFAVVPGEPLPQLFEAQASRTPAGVALVHAGGEMTYGELNARADRLARELRRGGVGPDVPVALCIKRSPEMVIAALAVLKAGGAYVPLDPAHPVERRRLVMEDLGRPLVLAVGAAAEDLASSARRILAIESVLDALDGSRPCSVEVQPGNLAYVIYTSGSTGRPKGAGIPHGALSNFLASMRRRLGLDERDVLLAVTTFSFDIAGLEIFLPLITGARVWIADRESTLDAGILSRLLREATLMQATPATWRLLLEHGWEGQPGLSMLCGGEALPRDLADSLLVRGDRLVNLYGPTETTIWSSIARVEAGPGPVTIGLPIENTDIHLLDGFLQPVPLGAPAELWIGGDGLARGYFGQPGLTAEKFLPHPFASRPGARLYRTGDLARRLASGGLEHLGRLDHQLKVRGCRIEPGEIEAVLLEHEAVRQALVVLRPDYGDCLVAYVLAESRPALASELRDLLRSRLPEYMVPAALVWLDAFPLTGSGKVDRRALPPPDPPEPSEAWVAPRTPVEEVLAGLWSEVLGLERVGSGDDFFALGGHSLLATRVMSRIRSVFGLELPLRELFEAPTVSGLAHKVVEAQRSSGGLPAAPPLTRREGGEAVPLSFAQQRLWFLDQLEPGNWTYNIPLALRLEGDLDIAALAAALDGLVRRHETLRTVFSPTEGGPVQVVRPVVSVLSWADLAALPQQQRETELRRLVSQEARRPFDLENALMLRSVLVRLAEQEHTLLLTVHHIASDGWSMEILARELTSLYEAAREDRPSPLPELPIQYADFAQWQREWLAGAVLEAEIAHWRRRLAGAPPSLELLTDRPRPALQGSAGRVERLLVDESVAAALRSLARQHGSTLFMVLLAGWQALLSRLTGQTDFTVGTPIAGRNRLELEGLIGFFVNTLVLRGDLAGDPTAGALLDRVREVVLEAHAHQDLPFEKLVEELQPERSLAHAPLFQVMLLLKSAAFEAASAPGELRTSRLAVESGATKFDLTLTGEERRGEGLGLTLAYRTDLFDAPTVRRLLGRLDLLLGSLGADPQRRISELPLLHEAEQAQILAEGSEPPLAPPAIPFFHRLFEAQAHETPEADALAFEEERLSYGELNRRANRLARVLRVRGVGPEVPVGLCLERSVAAITGMLAIFKAGGACVPLDPSLPAERLAAMEAESRVSWILTARRWLDPCGIARERALCLDELAAEIAAESGADLDLALAEENLAYVLFTSGSTGRSKGVAVEHRQLLSYVRAVTERLSLRPGMSFATVSTLSADLGHTAIFPVLCLGGCLHVISEARIVDADLLADYLDRHPVDGLKIVPSHLGALHGAFSGQGDGDGRRRLLPRRVLVLGGEASFQADVARLQELASDLAIFNHYGPTETTVGVLAGRFVPEPQASWATVPLGRPLAGVSARVLDRGLRLVPAGVPGELFVGGPSISRGYLHRPELTAERFVPDPFGAPGERLYRTGDLVRYLPDGRLEFLGRNDDQVKRRGFRVELGDIAAALRRHPGVREAVAVLRRQPAEQLVAYGVPRAEGAPAPTEAELRAFLRQRLPEAMIPDAFVLLPELPLTANGKLDRAALPAPDRVRIEGGRLAPRIPAEEILAGLWSELLGVEEPGVEDNFFDLGGHSLLATRLISRVRRVFAVDLPLRALFERPTIQGLAAVVDEMRGFGGPGAPPLRPVPRDGSGLPLSFGQQRLWIIAQLEPDSSAYNVPSTMRVEGQVDMRALRWALSEVARRHEVLRTQFIAVNDEPRQVVSPAEPVALPVVDLGALPALERAREARRLAAAEARRPFDLERGPLLRAGLLRLAEAEHAPLLTLHHIVSDAWSRDILRRELAELYAAAVEGRPPSLPELPVQYADFAQWQRSWLTGERLAAETAYWRHRLAGAPALDLPTDRPRPAVQGSAGGTERLRVGAELAGAVRALAVRRSSTLFMVLLAAWQSVLSRVTGQEDLSVGTPVAGRNRLELEELIGFFVNTLVLRGDLSGDPLVSDLLGRVREVVLEAHAHQDLPFEKLVEELNPERSLAHSPLFQVMLVVQNAVRGEAPALEGLRTSRLGGEDLESAKFDLTLGVEERRDGSLSLGLSYRTELFDPASVRRLLGRVEGALKGLTAKPELRLSELPLLSEPEVAQLREWNDTGRVGQEPGCLHELFSRQAALSPGAAALVDGEQEVRYGELERRSNRLANRLREMGVGPEIPVALCLERSTRMVVAILGVLKAGGMYVPLDPAYPPERLRMMLEDSAAPVIVTESTLADRVPETPGLRLLLDGEPGSLEDWSDETPESGAVQDNLAYVIYTSGSTGRPKGVAITHRNAAALLDWAREAYGPEQIAGVLAATSICFDLSVFELFVPLTRGGTVVLAANALALSTLPAAARVTLVNTVPSALNELVRSGGLPPSAATVNLAGEPLPPALVEQTYAVGTVAAIYNLYGPTEDTTYSTWARMERGGSQCPIGRPLPGTRGYVLDRRGGLVPPGAPGELFLGGAGLARGYLGRPELTAERFVPDPFGPPGSRLYRTGDLVRHLPDGSLAFLGRLDHQVKLRGFRIELGEVESALRSHGSVERTVAMAREDRPGDLRLVAYVVSSASGAVGEEALKSHVRGLLPEYMVPSRILILDELPLTPNGKIDRRALPAQEDRRGGEGPVPPRTPEEGILAGIWSEVLGVGTVGVTEGFFELGGHSLLALKLITRVRQHFGVTLPVSVLFTADTVESLALLLRREFPMSSPPLVEISGGGGGETLFLVHPGTGDVVGYAPLARHLARWRVYGLRAPGLEGEREPLDRVEDLAVRHLETVRSVQARGPYRLGGWSMGGLVALEMARLLESEGERVELTVLLDTRRPIPAASPEPEDDLRVLAVFAEEVGLRRELLGLTPEEVAAVAPERRLAWIFERVRDEHLLAPDMDLGLFERRLAVFRANVRAMREYPVRPYGGEVVLFSPAEAPAGAAEAWRDALPLLRIEPVGGNHLTLVREPHVTLLAERLKSHLREASGANAP